jgi:hypothetical protein
MDKNTQMRFFGSKVPKIKGIIQCDCGATVSGGRFQNHVWSKTHKKKGGYTDERRGFLTAETYIERYIDPEPGSEWYELKKPKPELKKPLPEPGSELKAKSELPRKLYQRLYL